MDSISSTYGYSPISSRFPASPLRDAPASGTAGSRLPDGPTDVTVRQQGVQVSTPPAEFTPYSSVSVGSDRKLSAADAKNSTKDAESGRGAGKPADKADAATQDPQIQAEVARLKSIESKVRAHEAAHKAAGGTLTGPISYTYQRGPDGKNYIVGGEVPIEISTGSTPQETISRMQQVISAALAPADPSPQDRAVAAQAGNIQQQARQQVASSTLPAAQKSPAEAEKSDKSQPEAITSSAPRSNSPRTSGASSAAEVFRPVSIYA